MKVGLLTTNQQKLSADMVSALGDQITMVQTARDYGWDSINIPQHYLNEGDNQQLQMVPFAARLAAEAGEMQVCLSIMLLNLHNPVYTAETIASMDIVCRGNFVFGIGLGYRDMEFDAFGVAKGQRVKRFVTYLDLIKRLWTEDSVSFDSPECKLDNVRMNLRPVQKPHPPIWIAANNDPAIRRAAKLGDSWFINPHATLETIRRQMGIYREQLKASGKPFPKELPVIKEIFCAKDKKTALDMAQPYLEGKYRDYAKWGQDKVMPGTEDFTQKFEELSEGRFILGSPEDCYEQLKPYWEEFGCNHLIVRSNWAGMPISNSLASIRLMSQELLPELRKVGRPIAEISEA